MSRAERKLPRISAAPRIVVLVFAFAPALLAAYSNLVATDDGHAVYFLAPGGLFVARDTGAGISVKAVSISRSFLDVDGSGDVVALAISRRNAVRVAAVLAL